MIIATFAAYLIGFAVGSAVDRGGPRLRRDWPIYLRSQLLATAGVVGVVSAWRLTEPRQIVGPILVAGVLGVLLLAAVFTRRGASVGEAALDSWAAGPNGAFWVLPIAGAFAGPPAVVLAALANAAYAVPNIACIHLLRRDAPHPQRRSTSWVDQSAGLAVGVGLLLHLAGPAPAASHWILVVAGPVFAFTGAALFTGSVVHPHNASAPRGPADVRRWLLLSAVRVAYLLPIALLAREPALAVVAALSAFGAPAFNPPQLAVLYGYRSGVVNVAARYGWTALPAGVVLAVLLR
jgi:uncharacterized membrane protein